MSDSYDHLRKEIDSYRAMAARVKTSDPQAAKQFEDMAAHYERIVAQLTGKGGQDNEK